MGKPEDSDFGLEFLLPFNGREHIFEGGFWVKFEIKNVPATRERPHGLAYSFTLHAPDGTRLLGFDNAHGVPPAGAKFSKRAAAHDHWHRTDKDPGRPYKFKDAVTLLTDFEREVTRVLKEHKIPMTVIAVREKDKSK
jgi:hypothetical protein